MSLATAISLSDARSNLGALVSQAHADHEPVFLERHGKRVAAIVDSDDLAHLMALAEDMQDILDAADARDEMAEAPETVIPWAEVKRDLGLE
ncbi:type II toxin-antitoxin system Phd/YefM family antitoxin [Frondihabitans australicus]|uniref:Antitoxin n=1 Tax=Frondihabitans australicus TaxID=386892 RepID=A0A495IJ43_9MICO|nr:type II toxin-antitoxin system Phd/YefM family antitoxin [Frondihabitans australicus]RKR76014.1 prevent-host-death family protein [Frondihabitans australicus]